MACHVANISTFCRLSPKGLRMRMQRKPPKIAPALKKRISKLTQPSLQRRESKGVFWLPNCTGIENNTAADCPRISDYTLPYWPASEQALRSLRTLKVKCRCALEGGIDDPTQAHVAFKVRLTAGE